MKYLGEVLRRNRSRTRGSKASARIRAAALISLVGSALAAACTFDPSDRCGPNQQVWGDNVRCVCSPGYGWTESDGCMKCPDDQQTGPLGSCVCKTGYVLGAAGCEPIPAGLGVDCSASGMCGAEPYSYCMDTDRGAYCTSKGCKTSADCAFGYACDVPSGVCLRPPVGLYMTCQSDADCAGTEATYCDVFFSHSCLVQGCTVSPNNCFEGSECCDLSTFGVAQPLCIPAGACTT